MKKEILEKYAHLIIKSGLNVQKEQEVVIRADVEQAYFVKYLVEEAYKAGAAKVDVDWRFVETTKLAIEYQSEETLGTVHDYEEMKLRYRSEKLPASLYLDSDDPDGLNGIDHAKWARAQQRIYKVTRKYSDAMENKYQWCVAAVPGKAWAKKVYPELPVDEAVEKLFEAILRCSRADGEDPVADWDAHNKNLLRRCDMLNSYGIRRLNYRSELTGTDFTVGLIPESRFMGGADRLPGTDIWFDANIPTEEVFVTPRKGDCEGIVYATRPLSYRGALIENFSIRFEKGKVTEVHAEKGEEALKLMVEMDDGAKMLGECALVPYNSPIRESGILFYDTLFDENASCHLALGEGYTVCIDGYENRSLEEMREMGVNESMIHEDFMIGAPDLAIDGITADGRVIPIFRNGDWAEN